jgi:hypothetical protein
MKWHPSHPSGSQNKPKVPSAAPGPSTPSANASPSPPRIYSFFCIANVQCRKIQRLPLKFNKFMDGWELRRWAILREHSGGGTPYEVEVWYDGAGEQFFKGGCRDLRRITTSIRGFSWPLISMLTCQSSTWESTTAPSARRSMKPKYSFTSFLLYVISFPSCSSSCYL